jgi:hypothetical protein
MIERAAFKFAETKQIYTRVAATFAGSLVRSRLCCSIS